MALTVLLVCNIYVAMMPKSLNLARACCAGLCTNMQQMAIVSQNSIPVQLVEETNVQNGRRGCSVLSVCSFCMSKRRQGLRRGQGDYVIPDKLVAASEMQGLRLRMLDS